MQNTQAHLQSKGQQDQLIPIIYKKEGIIIDSTTLSIESTMTHLPNFWSHPEPALRHKRLQGKQIIAHEICVDILSQRYPKIPFLPLPYSHSITLGALTLELLPNGYSLGGSFLIIKKAHASLLLASTWNFNQHSASPYLLRRVPTLLISKNTIPEPTDTQTQADLILNFIEKILELKENVILVTHELLESFDLALFLAKHRFPVALDPYLQQLFTACHSHLLPSHAKIIENMLTPSYKPYVFLTSPQHFNDKNMPEGIIGATQKAYAQIPVHLRSLVAETLSWSIAEQPEDILRLIDETRCHHCILAGHAAHAWYEPLASQSKIIEILSPCDSLF